MPPYRHVLTMKSDAEGFKASCKAAENAAAESDWRGVLAATDAALQAAASHDHPLMLPAHLLMSRAEAYTSLGVVDIGLEVCIHESPKAPGHA